MKRACINWPTRASWSATRISEKTYTTALCCQVERPASRVLRRGWARNWCSLRPRRWKSRLPPLLKENTPYGSAGPSWAACRHSKQCGSERKTMKQRVPRSSTGNASDQGLIVNCFAIERGSMVALNPGSHSWHQLFIIIISIIYIAFFGLSKWKLFFIDFFYSFLLLVLFFEPFDYFPDRSLLFFQGVFLSPGVTQWL